MEKKAKAEPAEPKTWEEQIAKREYQIKLRKETSEYKAYISHRPRSKRRDDEPQTPRCDCREDNGKKVSKRHWEYLYWKWSSELKEWPATHAPEYANK